MTDIAPHSATDPHRRFLDQTAAPPPQRTTPTLVGQGSHFDGELRCQGDLSIAGSGQGKARVEGTLLLADTGLWQGEIVANNAILAGQFSGHLTVSGKLEVRTSARIQGEVTAAQLAIAEGAIIEGNLQVLSDAPIQRFVEKRSKR